MNKLDLADALCREEVRRMVKSGEIAGDSDPGVIVSVVMEKVAKLFSIMCNPVEFKLFNLQK
jgi:hypothetical protein